MPLRGLFERPKTNPSMSEVLERSRSNRAALSATVNSAITASIANQPANTAQSYVKAQKLWKEFCANRQFDNSVLVSKEKLVLWMQKVVLQLRIPEKPTRKRKGDVVTPAVLRQKKRKGEALAVDPEVKQLAEGLGMSLEELLKELPVMLADDKAVEVEEGRKEGIPTAGEDEGFDRFLKAGTVDLYIAAVLQLYKVQQALGHNTNRHPRGGILRDVVRQTKEAQDLRNREAFVDRGVGCVNAGYSNEEFLSLQQHLLKSACQHSSTYPHFLCTCLDVFMRHFYVLQGKNHREAELADLQLSLLQNNQNPAGVQTGALKGLREQPGAGSMAGSG